ncbi:MAG TPA: YsnF/AvaK domain-containing protein [Noviherbaspirillum sp.]|uniref:YsnF/AvaK domain-containing protein n=1 Tax=Noviherbaspirillum sp. TaxID=1926288 RepID=UPI002D37B787|nr:YsnF/AvaK domain-containing protein [Noviherbaspirillum sp.]HYD94793.1 YsnF/AvaK domain-containing protein [Noviherbaspirillum sp.]
MENTVVGVYDSYAQAQNVMNELLASGFSRSDVQLSPESDRAATGDTTTTTTDQHSGSGIGHFFRSLFGMDDDEDRTHGDMYSEAVRRGHCVLTVNAASDEQRERAVEVMNRFDPVDIDERSSQWRSEGWTGYDAAAPMYTDSEVQKDRSMYSQGRSSAGMTADSGTTGSTAGMSAMSSTADTGRTAQSTTGEQTRIPIVEEELKVGKRAVQRGGVRIFSRVTERPVQESVDLRQEHVSVERHRVDQPATEADMAAFKEGSVELREMGEEAVVSKTARVVEEVVVGKEVTQETADINDTVRRTEVDVEQLGASGSGTMRTDYADTSMTADDSDFRTHWQTAYGQSGGRYEDYDAAYRYGSTMAGSDERYKNYRWEDAEPNLRSDWERNHPESTWDKVKDAVRYGAERVTGRGRH